MLPAANALVVTVGTRRSRPCRPSDPWRPRRADRYERRRPEQTPLHRVISRHLETWLAARSLGERPVPTHVEGELREYLRCGILCFGFARARCTGCGHGFLVAFSCQGRDVCPSCTGRRMAESAAHLADRVIPPVPVRQWVISVPKRLRGVLADRPAAVTALTRIFLDEIERTLRPERIRYSLPRHKRGQWVGPGRKRKATAPGENGVVDLSPFEFLDRLADLVPPPRRHRHRYHGVFAPNHPLRPAVTALAIANATARAGAASSPPLPLGEGRGEGARNHEQPRSHDTSRIAWAKLLAKIAEDFPLACPACGGDIRLIAFIIDPATSAACEPSAPRADSRRVCAQADNCPEIPLHQRLTDCLRTPPSRPGRPHDRSTATRHHRIAGGSAVDRPILFSACGSAGCR